MVCEWQAPLLHSVAVRGLMLLNGQYPITYGDVPVGKADISNEGLYYCIACHVDIHRPGFYRISICTETQTVDLGLCVPCGNGLSLRKKIPMKNILGKIIAFSLKDPSQKTETEFHILDPQQPFLQLARIKDGKFTIRNGRPGIIFDP